MQRKWMLLFTGFVLFSLILTPASVTRAQVQPQVSGPGCPPDVPAQLHDKGFLQSLPPECAEAYRESMRSAGIEAHRPDVLPMLVGGPDAFGYTYDDTVPYNWISATTDSGLGSDDKVTGPINIGFNFPFYGITQSQLYLSAKGVIFFGARASKVLITNNLIAPFSADFQVGSGYNSGAIYYSQGGSLPNRYLVVEWRNVTTGGGRAGPLSTFSFEAILYENGDILVQHQSLPSPYYFSKVGIENSLGDESLQYQSGSSGLSALNAILFSYPTVPAARVLLSPLEATGFSALGGTSDFALTVTNTGTMGPDTYDLTAASAWPVTFYAANGLTPLTDTDSDSIVDTGSLAQESAVTITAKIATPGGAVVGDSISAVITARSSLNTAKSKTTTLQTAVPAAFAQVYDDYHTDGAMRLDLIHPNAQVVKKATSDGYYGLGPAVVVAPNGNFVYVWYSKLSNPGSLNIWEIEYTLLDRYGKTLLPVTKLTDNSGATTDTFDGSPAVAVAPDGRIGIIWQHSLYDSNTGQYNSNIYFAILDGAGNLLSGPMNITNNGGAGAPAIAASDDNRFILGWDQDIDAPSYSYNIWYAVRDTAGASIFSPTALTSDNKSHGPILNSLVGGNAIITWYSKAVDHPTYAVLNSNGTVSKAATPFIGNPSLDETPDAVLLSNGKVAVAWVQGASVMFMILNSSYVLETGPTSASSPYLHFGEWASVTTDSSGHVIITWIDNNNNLFYALGDSTGAFVTAPMLYRQSDVRVEISKNGYGNAPYSLPAGVDGVASFSASLFGGPPAGNAGVGIHYTNHGAEIATGVALTVTLDSNLTYVSDTSGVVPSVVGNTVTWNLPNMAPLGEQDFTLYVGVPSGATIGTRYPISLSLTSNEPDLNASDNIDNADVTAVLQVLFPLMMR